MNDRKWKLIRQPAFAAAGLAISWSGQASAQQLEASGYTFSTPTREIEIDLTGIATYDTNVARSGDAGAAARGVKKEDVKLTSAVQAKVVLPTSAAVLTLTGAIGYDAYLRNSRLNRERLDLTAGAGKKLAVCDVGTQVAYSRGQTDLADLSIVPGDPEASAINVQETFRVGGSVTCGRRFRPTAFVQHRTTNNSAAERRISDVDTLTYGGGLSYSNERFGVLTAFAGRSEYDFPARTQIPGALQSFEVTMWGVRLDRRLGARLQVHGQVSYVDVSGTGAAMDRFDGLNLDASAQLRIGARAQLTLSALRQIDASAAFNVRTAQVRAYSAQLEYAFSPLLRGVLTASVRDRDFESDPSLAPIVLLEDDRLAEVGGRLNYTLGRRTTFSLSAGYQERSADVAIYDYSSFRAAAGLSIRL